MTTIQSVLYTRLSTHAALTSLTGLRIFPVEAPDGTARPYLTYHLISRNEVTACDGDAGVIDQVIQIDVWAESYAGARAVAEVLKTRLTNWKDAATTPAVLRTFKEDERDDYEDDTRIFRASLDFRLHTQL